MEDITTSTIDKSLTYPIQDDITDSVRTFVPCAAGLLPHSAQIISPGKNRSYDRGFERNVKLKRKTHPSLPANRMYLTVQIYALVFTSKDGHGTSFTYTVGTNQSGLFLT